MAHAQFLLRKHYTVQEASVMITAEQDLQVVTFVILGVILISAIHVFIKEAEKKS